MQLAIFGDIKDQRRLIKKKKKKKTLENWLDGCHHDRADGDSEV